LGRLSKLERKYDDKPANQSKGNTSRRFSRASLYALSHVMTYFVNIVPCVVEGDDSMPLLCLGFDELLVVASTDFYKVGRMLHLQIASSHSRISQGKDPCFFLSG
jgi:hypothetical protein